MRAQLVVLYSAEYTNKRQGGDMPFVDNRLAYAVLGGYRDMSITLSTGDELGEVTETRIRVNGKSVFYSRTTGNKGSSLSEAREKVGGILRDICDMSETLLVSNESPYARAINPNNKPLTGLDVFNHQHAEKAARALFRKCALDVGELS